MTDRVTPGAVECYCGADIEARTLPDDVADIAGTTVPLWVHVATGDIYCYPEGDDFDRSLKAEPVTTPVSVPSQEET